MRLGRHYLIVGRVQGVGFRFFACSAAALEGLHGWVRNLPDGGVEIVAEGEAESLDRFEQQMRQGPRASHVVHVEVSDVGASGNDSGFGIR